MAATKTARKPARKPTTKAAPRLRAPKGGITIGGRFFKGGQFLAAGTVLPTAAPVAPAPTKADLPRLLAALTSAEIRLGVEGSCYPNGGIYVVEAREEYDRLAALYMAAYQAA